MASPRCASREDPVLIVIGLGNPGAEYAATRHNLGFQVVDELARRQRLRFVPGGRTYAEASGPWQGRQLVLLKPMTYMNRSGNALRAWGARHGIRLSGRGPVAGPEGESTDVLVPVVVCDDLALPLGGLRIRARGSAGGQKGLASIIAAIGGEEFPRVRLGIGAAEATVPAAEWSDYVLEPFASDERELAAELVRYGADAVTCLLTEGVEAAASRFNRRQPPLSEGWPPSENPPPSP
jgi:PTH1 family peptidyl-tRNA hydrolase